VAGRRLSGGALGLLEPGSSDSESGQTCEGGSRTTPAQTLDHLEGALSSRECTHGPEEAEVASPEQASRIVQPPPAFAPRQLHAAAADGDLASFIGPDEGQAPRWSEGPLPLPDGVELPECIAACLRPYQRDGVVWLYERLFLEARGCLLTDEMGLGKTVQVACCLAAGLYGRSDCSSKGDIGGPVLVLCPPTLVQNWARELRRWGPFAVEVLTASGGPSGGRLRSLQRLEAGLVDVLVASRGLVRTDEDAVAPMADNGLCGRSWGCVVIDEVHQAKNPKGLLHRALVSIDCPRKLGLSGTPLQNCMSDVWALLRIVGAHERWDQGGFESHFGKPIARGQKRKATIRDLSVREEALKEFRELLDRSCLRRTKADVKLMLPGKNDRIVPCPLSCVQRAAYKNLLESPDWQLAAGKRELCVCGAGRPCLCGTGPIWRYIHKRQAEQKGLEDEWAAADDCVCRGRCPPRCLSLSLIVVLQRVANHIEVLKPDSEPPKDSGEAAQQALMRDLCEIAFAGIDHNLCAPRRVANRLQLGSPDACGKMQMLLPLLRHWRRRGQKVLIFSRSTRLLDILAACLWQQGCSPEVLRLDGGTPSGHRQRLVDEFNTSSTRGIFLISTRAGGVGLNLTSASIVVIFDPDWNPFSDLQAQDRSFRIGQTRVVEVYRLLSAGTIEEQVYVRQVWKQQLAAAAIDGTRHARRLDDGAFGINALFELHDDSLLPSLMAEAYTMRSSSAAARPAVVETSEAGIRIFSDQRGGACAGLKLSDLWRTDSDQEGDNGGDDGDEVSVGSDNDGLGGAPAPHRRRRGEQQCAGVQEKAATGDGPTQALEVLHGMFGQVDHAKLMRSDTQEEILLMDLPAEDDD